MTKEKYFLALARAMGVANLSEERPMKGAVRNHDDVIWRMQFTLSQTNKF